MLRGNYHFDKQSFRFCSAKYWSLIGHFSRVFSKGPLTTTWIWDIHSCAHDFEFHDLHNSSVATVARKVLASNLAHISLVFFWLSFLAWNGSYYSNYWSWLKDEKHCLPSVGKVWSIVGQDLLNSDVGLYQQGIYTTSGLFQLWRAQGIVDILHLKYTVVLSFFGCVVSLIGSFVSMHLSFPHAAYYKKYRSMKLHKLAILYGLGSISWCGHIIHISIPINACLDEGVDSSLIPRPASMLTRFYNINSSAFSSTTINFGAFSNATSGELGSLNPHTGGILMEQLADHHCLVGIVFIFGSLISLFIDFKKSVSVGANSWHFQLAINLAFTGSLSIAYANAVYLSVYPFCSSDYPTVICLFSHHQWIGGLLIVGAGSHASICLIRDYNLKDNTHTHVLGRSSIGVELILAHRDVIISHLVWASVSLGLHSYGLYIHNDTMQALGRPQDIFTDNSICLRPVFGCFISRFLGSDVEVLETKVIRSALQLGTADFLVHHIHAFTIHTTVLILVKGLLFSRSSRLVADKLELGFRYPCDGPGRGGTCQISPWDHIYLAVFWMYNSISIVIFHYFWKMQSDVWGIFKEDGVGNGEVGVGVGKIAHIQPDFSVNSVTINGWLRNFLWSGSAQVLQSYGTPLAGYGLIFLWAHFLWAFSLMFLFSGRGYWQELIESIVWAHHKLWIIPRIQPRALSITHGRSVGLVHFILGGIGCTWSFFIARIIAVSCSLS